MPAFQLYCKITLTDESQIEQNHVQNSSENPKTQQLTILFTAMVIYLSIGKFIDGLKTRLNINYWLTNW